MPAEQFFAEAISTHALTEGDFYPAKLCRPLPYFNSRPHGGRQCYLLQDIL